MNKQEVVINIEDIYYKHHDEDRKNLLDNNSNFCYSFFTCLFSCFL